MFDRILQPLRALKKLEYYDVKVYFQRVLEAPDGKVSQDSTTVIKIKVHKKSREVALSLLF